MSSLNLKQQVKEGKMTPERAMELMLERADNVVAAADSRTGRWLRSPNAQKRYKQGRKQSQS